MISQRRVGSVARATYALSQTTRVGWFVGQSLLASWLFRRRDDQSRGPDRTGVDTQAEATDAAAAGGGGPPIRDLLGELRALMRQDFHNIQAGYYRKPEPLYASSRTALAATLRFFRDVPAVQARRARRGNAEVFRAPPPGTETLPRYYRQNFHYQTDGWLSHESAARYDHQVEVLFGGGADAMRRQALVPLAEVFRRRPVRTARLLDVGTGTGRFLRSVKENYPRLDITAIDLSPFYLAHARHILAPWSATSHFIQAPAEALPFADNSFDVVTSVYLFHELPKKIRMQAATEMARVLKPGGSLILTDSLQLGDRPKLDDLLLRFPRLYHEPYYDEYIRSDIPALFRPCGLTPHACALAFLSKVWHMQKAET